MKKLLFITLCLTSFNCFAIHKILPLQYQNQNKIFSNGEEIVTSSKQNTVFISAKDGVIKKGRGSLFFAIRNESNVPFNLQIQNVTLTDQYGRRIYIVPKHVLLKEEQTRTNWKKFGSFICTAIDAMNAQNAGFVEYQDTTVMSANTCGWGLGPRGCGIYGQNVQEVTTSCGTYYSEELRNQAFDRVNANAMMRDIAIESESANYKNLTNNFYFDANTIFANSVYESGFQFEIPTKVEKQLQYLTVDFDLGTEHHTFCFQCV